LKVEDRRKDNPGGIVLAIEVEEDKGPDLSEVESDDLVNLYFREVVHVPLLDAEQERELATMYREGEKASERLAELDGLKPKERKRLEQVVHQGQQARVHLIKANCRLVIALAKKYLGLGVPFMDLVQEGNIGLMKAIERFKPELGHKLSTYTTWWIRQALTRAVAAQGRTIRLPVHKQEEIRRLKHASSRIRQRLGREPTREELAEALDMNQGKVKQLITVARRTISLEKPIRDDGESTLGQFIEDERSPSPMEVTTRELAKESIEQALTCLTPRQERVLRLRYGLGDGDMYTFGEIAKKLGLTRERIRQIEGKALRKLRHPSHRHKLEGFLSR